MSSEGDTVGAAVGITPKGFVAGNGEFDVGSEVGLGYTEYVDGVGVDEVVDG